MKKSIFILVMMAFMIGSLETGCKKSEKVEEEKVTDAAHEERQDAKIEKVEQQVEINEAEWNNFKNEVDADLKANEAVINDLKGDIKKSGKKYDAAYIKNVDTLEKKQVELQKEVSNYDKKNQKDWDQFKSRVKSDMESIGKELKDLKGGKKKK